mgnify:CR=1 FL=1
MGRDLTKRYVDELLEVSGVKRSGINRIQEISRMSDSAFKELLRDIGSRATRHYQRNLSSIVQNLQKNKGQSKSYYFGSGVHLGEDRATRNLFVRKSSLYYDKIVLIDPLATSPFRERLYSSAFNKEVLVGGLESLHLLWPWFAERIVELVPSAHLDQATMNRIDELCKEDYHDPNWFQQALKNEQLKLEGEDLLDHVEGILAESLSADAQRSAGDLRQLAL